MTSPWQIYFYIVPQTVKDSIVPFNIKWKNSDIFYSIDTYFHDKLWKEKGIKENITQYGNISETCIEVHEKDGEYSVMFSIDLRRVTEEFLNTLCEFCKFREAILLTQNGKLINATFKNLINLIANSEAVRFCMYVEPHFARRRDEYDYNRSYWWEKYVPENRKFHNFFEIDKYVSEFFEKLKSQ